MSLQGIGGEGIVYYELRPEFKDKSSKELEKAAREAIQAGQYGMAGAFIRSLPNRDALFSTLSGRIEAKEGSSSAKAYDGMKAFLYNSLG